MQPLRNDFVATGYVLTPDHDKVLLIFHKKLGKWLPPGGHLDRNELPHMGALREIFEETGVHARIIDASYDLTLTDLTESQLPTPHFMLHEVIPATHKEEMHMHIDFIYVMEAQEVPLTVAEAEVGQAGWFTRDQVDACDTFLSVKRICGQIMKAPTVNRFLQKEAQL